MDLQSMWSSVTVTLHSTYSLQTIHVRAHTSKSLTTRIQAHVLFCRSLSGDIGVFPIWVLDWF